MSAQGARPRVVLATRRTRLDVLLEVHGTLGQAQFYLESRGAALEPLVEQHERFEQALRSVQQGIPPDQRRVRVDRDSLDRFLFAPDDIVLIVGQDGLVPNVAKYLRGQLTAGINPDPLSVEGVLCAHAPAETVSLLEWLEHGTGRLRVSPRVMAQAQREDGQTILALNEVFIGHASHQSARYRLQTDSGNERQSSSGVICSTGTGATGWARSICTQMGLPVESLPGPEEAALAWFVREPWPSIATGAKLRSGFLKDGRLVLSSEMGTGGVVFADGIETDRLEFLEGQTVVVDVAPHRLNLVLPA